ncbi:MAG: hypothetical protein R3B90_22430 [Planctomycetaceae bacterium]
MLRLFDRGLQSPRVLAGFRGGPTSVGGRAGDCAAARSIAHGNGGRVRWLAPLLCLIAIGVASPATAATWEGLDVNISADWPGCGYGGYFPIRVSINNRGKPRHLDVIFASSYGAVPNVSRSLDVETERVDFSLLVPLVSYDAYGNVRVYVDGTQVSQLSDSVSLPDMRSTDEKGPAVLLISNRDAAWSNFNAGIDNAYGVSSGYSASSGHSYYSPSIAEDHGFLQPELLPEEWQAYTGLDVVAVSEADWDRVSQPARTAILKWVETGGNLLYYDIAAMRGDPDAVDDAQLASLKGRFQLTGAADAAYEWSHWGNGYQRTFLREKLFGRIAVVTVDPFNDFNDSDWQQLLSRIGISRLNWTDRHGFISRTWSRDFMDFLVPSVKGVPVVAFLVLITLFSIVIGPVNYIYLWKRKRLHLLVVTIPLIAFVTSLSLFGYSAIAHGFATRERVRSVTVIDQQANTALTSSRISLYSGLAPSGGMTFSRNSSVLPIWPPDGGFEAGTVDWTNGQHFQSGWLRSRTRTQFFVTTHRDERGRLEITPEPDSLSISNGLEWNLAALMVTDEQGRSYFGTDIAAGDGARLQPISAADTLEMTRRLGVNLPQLPPNYNYTPDWDYRYGPYGSAPQESVSLQTNRVEQTLRSLTRPDGYVAWNAIGKRYFAILDESPEIDDGLDSVQEEASTHILIGYY